jgi:hypothetical protein
MLNNCISKIMQRFGQNIEIITGSPQLQIATGKAFIGPLKMRTLKYLTGEYVAPGFANSANYLYIGPKDLHLDLCPKDTVIQTANRRYCLKKAQKVYFGESPLYVWAILSDYYEDGE